MIGHPVAPVVGDPGLDEPLAVSVVAEESTDGILGLLRSSLGGATAYDVTVTVKNRSTETIDRVRLAGSAGRNPQDELTTIELSEPGPIGPGQTWEEVVHTDLPAPVYGAVEWRVTASSAETSITTTDATRHTPWLLILLAVIFMADVLVIVWRGVTKRLRRGDGSDLDDPPGQGDPPDGEWPLEASADNLSSAGRPAQLVG